MPHPEIVADDRNRCGEAPIWDAASQALFWGDIEAGTVFQLTPSTGESAAHRPGFPLSGMALNRDGSLVIAGASDLWLWRPGVPGRRLATCAAPEPVAFNDIIADGAGRIYAGTIHWGTGGMVRRGELLLVDGDGLLTPVDDGIELANGLGFSPDGRTLYFADSAARRVHAHDVDARSGSLSRKRVFVEVPREDGIPDGLTVDADGFVWVALWYGAQVARYDPDGKVERRIRLPVKQVSSVAFGGPDLSDLYITTAAQPWASPLAPEHFDFTAADMGGALYRIRAGVRGLKENLARFQARD